MAGSPSHYDVIIVGQGLAGTTLAWQLREAGMRIAIVDRGERDTASRVAAGLITPITGPRLAKTHEWEVLWPAALQFYRQLEQLLQVDLFRVGESIRLFADEAQRDLFQRRLQQPEFAARVDASDLRLGGALRAPFGGFVMKPTARLDVGTYLQTSRKFFESEQLYFHGDLNLPVDVTFHAKAIQIPKLNLTANRLILCQGYVPELPCGFARVPFRAAKGEILTVSIPELHEHRAIHDRIWIAPEQKPLFRIGATFEWHDLTNQPTTAGRTELLQKSAQLLDLPLKVVDQRGAVRPVIRDFHPVVGLHPDLPQVGILNGLGAKGSLLAPTWSTRLVQLLLNDQAIPVEGDVARWFR
ncbi:NAD(P)/FAD-dependent oxidoreductase [Planctomicrobium sp. SH664]|uniref:NAD(P)/FAD-dependent oxidoreductase n=1 Tax=Planctomicrobium sp. SH664 TaxID=3448125 RepID=UPI003F5C4646